jgi:hypothetical protein
MFNLIRANLVFILENIGWKKLDLKRWGLESKAEKIYKRG